MTAATVNVADAVASAENMIDRLRTALDTDESLPPEVRRLAHAELDHILGQFYVDVARAVGGILQ
jgi:hypothetical protein